MEEIYKEKIGKKMLHPVLGEITITNIRENDGYIIAYFLNSFCNFEILKNIENLKHENRN